MKYDLSSDIRSRLEQARDKMDKMTQTELAKQTGIGQTTISKIEGGLQNTITQDQLDRWADATNVTTDWLLGKSKEGGPASRAESGNAPVSEESAKAMHGVQQVNNDDLSRQGPEAASSTASTDKEFGNADPKVTCDEAAQLEKGGREMNAAADPITPDMARHEPTKNSYRTPIISALVILGLVLISSVLWSVNSSAKVSISHLRMFDDSYRDGPAGKRTLTSLHRKAQYYDITSTDEFLLALGFVISGYATTPEGGVKIEIKLSGLSNEAKRVWETHHKFSRVDDWKEMRVPKRGVGAPAVLQEFRLNDGAAIPVITVVECAEPEQLAQWTGSIVIEVRDEMSGRKDSDTVKIDLKKPASLKNLDSCH
jgi:transcriptional regulator with XRE-family HTH domain